MQVCNGQISQKKLPNEMIFWESDFYRFQFTFIIFELTKFNQSCNQTNLYVT